MSAEAIFLDIFVKSLLVAYYAIIIFVIWKDVRRFKQVKGTWLSENVLTNFVMVFALGFIAIFFVLKLDFTNLSETQPWFIIVPLILILTPPLLWGLIGVTSAYHRLRGHLKNDIPIFEDILKQDADPKLRKQLNRNRKTLHYMIFFGFIAFLVIVSPIPKQLGYDFVEFWGDTTGMVLRNYLYASHPYAITQGILITTFYLLSWLFLSLDCTRLSPRFHFPFSKLFERTLRPSELKTYASAVHMATGFLFASIFLPPTLLISVLALFTFGDSTAASVGIRFGKHKIGVNREKSWEGTLGGFLASFLVGIPFVGYSWAFSAALLFVLIDIFTPKPIPISDNILIPITIPLLYTILAWMGIPATCYLLSLLA